MDEKSPKAQEPEVKNAAAAEGAVAEQYCPICGRYAGDPALFRFGEYFCSEAHVAEFASAVRERAGEAAEDARGGTTAAATAGAPKKGGSWSLLKMGACCGGALLLLALIPLVAATGGSLAAVGSSLLGIVALLACPLGMYFMMRGMQRMDHRGKAPAAGSPGIGGRARETSDDAGR